MDLNPPAKRYFLNKKCLSSCEKKYGFDGALIILNNPESGGYYLWSGHVLWEGMEFNIKIKGDTLLINYSNNKYHFEQDTLLFSSGETKLRSSGSTRMIFTKFKEINKNKIPQFLFDLYPQYFREP